MEKSRIKEILIKMRDTNGWDDFKCESYHRAYRILKRYTKRKRSEGDGNFLWLYENFYLLEESYAEIKVKRYPRRLRAAASFLVKAMAETEDVDRGVSAFFETVSDVFSDEEIEKLYHALLLESIIHIKNELFSKGDVSAFVNLIRRIREFDFTPFYLGFFTYEQSLRRDAVYPMLDRETKALYKSKIKKYAKKQGATFSDACVMLSAEAEEKKCHIGELLDFSRNTKKRWIYLYVTLFLALSLLFLRVT